ALVDRRHATGKISFRWDVLPVVVRGAAQHAKVAALGWSNHVRILVGSGNLTPDGYRKKLEGFRGLAVSRDEVGPMDQGRACLDFLDQVIDRALGDPEMGPRRRARDAVARLRVHMQGWPAADTRRVVPIFGSPGKSVLDQLRATWPSGGPPRRAYVL